MRGEFDGVVDQIDDNLAQAGDIAEDPWRHTALDDVGQIDALGRGLTGKEVQRLLDADRELEGTLLQIHPAGFDL